MARTHFESLRVYQLAEKLGDTAWDVVAGWSILARDTVGKQLIRAADSVGANIAEGSGRGSTTERRQFARIARGSFYETKHWLRRAFARKLLTQEQTAELKVIVDELTLTLNGYIRSLKPNDQSPKSSSRNRKPKNLRPKV